MTRKILRVISSPRGEASVSIKLGNAIVEKIKAKYPGSIVQERNLVTDAFPHLQEAQINLFFTPTERLTREQSGTLKNSGESVAELQDADIIVIDAPMYNYTISSYLKAYIDHVVRYGVTFLPDGNGAVQGLVKNKKVYVAVSTGFIYSAGPYQEFDFLVPYLKMILGWIGMTDVTFIKAEGMNIPVVQDTALQHAIDSIVIE